MSFIVNFISKEMRRMADRQALEAFPARMRRLEWAVHREWVGSALFNSKIIKVLINRSTTWDVRSRCRARPGYAIKLPTARTTRRVSPEFSTACEYAKH